MDWLTASQAVPIDGGDERHESGYIMAMTALLLIPLMIFAAFSVDVGAWYAHAARAQRAADAASLAAVVYMPDYGSAQTAALDQAARKGFTSAPVTLLKELRPKTLVRLEARFSASTQ